MKVPCTENGYAGVKHENIRLLSMKVANFANSGKKSNLDKKDLKKYYTSRKNVAVILGLQQITALNTVRSLAEMHVPVIGITSDPRHPCARTRFAEKVFCRNINSLDLIDTLIELGKRFNKKAFLLPTSDPQVHLISENREVLTPYYYMAFPSKDVVELLLHKDRFSVYAQENNLPIPKTLNVQRESSLKEVIEDISFPCVLKPFDKTPEWGKHFSDDKILLVDTRKKLAALLPEILRWIDRLLVQEWIEGEDKDVYFCLMYFDENSKPKATFGGRKLRQWPPYTGNTAIAEACYVEEVIRQSIELFKSVRYHGIGSVEYKLDKRDGKYKIMEPTVGRPNLQSYLSVTGGINLNYIAYCDKCNVPMRHLDEVQNPGTKVKWVNEFADLESARFYKKKHKLNNMTWIKSLNGKKSYALWILNDPLPFLLTIANKINHKSKKILRG